MSFFDRFFGQKRVSEIGQNNKYSVGFYNSDGKESGILSAEEFGFNSLGLVEAMSRSAITSVLANDLNVSSAITDRVEKNAQMLFSLILGLHVAAYQYMLTEFKKDVLDTCNIEIDDIHQEMKKGIQRGAELWFGMHTDSPRKTEHDKFIQCYLTIFEELLIWHECVYKQKLESCTNPFSMLFSSKISNDIFENATELDILSLEVEIGLSIENFINSADQFVRLKITTR